MFIGIIGLGVLGSAQFNWLRKNTKHTVMVYDKNIDKCTVSFDRLARTAQLVILCLPTDGRENWDHDLTNSYLDIKNIRNILQRLSDKTIIQNQIVIIRSTMPVGATRTLSREFKKFRLLFIPEFLTEKTAQEDFNSEDKIILGVGDPENKIELETARLIGTERIYPIFESFDEMEVVTYEVAEMLKLATNSFYATKVIFANELNGICEKLGVNYNTVRNLLAENKRIGSSIYDNQGSDVHLRVAQDGKAGYGGKCLPKDTMELLWTAKRFNVELGLLEKVDEINEKIRHGD